MKFDQSTFWRAGLSSVCFAAVAGCSSADIARQHYSPQRVPALGQVSDAIWQDQEVNAEAAKFVVYLHEFQNGTARLNLGGEDHVKQIATRLQEGVPFPVVIERSMNTPIPSEYQFPVHPNPALDNERRQVVVAALRLMGVADAEQRVVVAPAFSEAATSQEAEAAYLRGLQNGRTSGDFGGGFGGFGGGGVF
jgi:hypothetical protein